MSEPNEHEPLETNKGLEPPTITLRDKKWHYVSEGNANIILAIPEDGTVLRIMKNDGDDETTPAEMSEMLSKQVDFCNALRRLFFADRGRDYVDVPVPMSFLPEELHEIDGRLRQHRPANRRHKGLNWTGGLVALYPDYTLLPDMGSDRGPVFCAEIKPKQGWSHAADRTAGRVAECAFCAHQYLKLCRADVERVSRYCPLDLFSGDRDRVARAVVHLLWTPQNNLKMFRDGFQLCKNDADRLLRTMFDGDEGDHHIRFARFAAAALLGDFENGDREGSDGVASGGRFFACAEKPPCNFDAVPMPHHCVLHSILTMQKMQTAGFAAVCSAYERLPGGAKQFDHVDRLRTCSPTSDGSVVLSPVDGYLVAATARDCSVFVTFCRTNDDRTVASGHLHVVRFGGQRYAVRVKVSDLDPKPLSTVGKHRERNADVSLACERYLRRLSHEQ